MLEPGKKSSTLGYEGIVFARREIEDARQRAGG
jgi:hypothetical protein